MPQQFHQNFGRLTRRRGILPRNQQPIRLHINSPIRTFAVPPTRLFELILHVSENNGRQPAAGRHQRDFRPGIRQFIIRCRKLLLPKTRLLTGVPQFAVRGQNNQDFHDNGRWHMEFGSS